MISKTLPLLIFAIVNPVRMFHYSWELNNNGDFFGGFFSILKIAPIGVMRLHFNTVLYTVDPETHPHQNGILYYTLFFI
jgi:hypothetical protein